MSPDETGSPTSAMTIGTVVVASLAAAVVGLVKVDDQVNLHEDGAPVRY